MTETDVHGKNNEKERARTSKHEQQRESAKERQTERERVDARGRKRCVQKTDDDFLPRFDCE